MPAPMDDEQVINQVIESLLKHPNFSRSQVEATVREEFNALADRPVRDYLSILTERAARKRLRESLTPQSRAS